MYRADYSSDAFNLLLAEFNSENALELTLDDVVFENFSPDGGDNGQSSIEMRCINPSIGLGTVRLSYTRMSLPYIFSKVELQANTSAYLALTDTPAVTAGITTSLQKRYKFNLPSDQFQYEIIGGTLYLQATENNLLYTGQVPVYGKINHTISLPVPKLFSSVLTHSKEIISVYPLSS